VARNDDFIYNNIPFNKDGGKMKKSIVVTVMAIVV